MAHTILGTIVLLIALSLVGIAIVVVPILRYLQISKTARFAFGAMMISLGAYLAWVANLFFHDNLAAANYSRELVTLRVITLISTVWFLVGAIRCSAKIARIDSKVSTRIVREDGYEHPCPKWREDDQ